MAPRGRIQELGQYFPGECFENACEKWTDEKGRGRYGAQKLEKDDMSGV